MVMIKRHVFLMLGGLGLAFGFVVGNARGSLSGDDIEILSDPRPSAPDRIDLGRSFSPALCVSRQGGITLRRERMPEQAVMDAADVKDDG